ncbi:MAG: class I SAM-dependent methyltransferase [Magnetococcales bacterium]|nr:class I SAM-dependent methyltransferase [Magnetococcales bacterium]
MDTLSDPHLSQRQRIENDVLAVYQKVNPSTRFLDRSPADFELEGGKRQRLFQDYLKFPLKMFQGARMLDFGSGTGERAIFYNRWGARMTMVEMNPLAVERAKKIFTQYALPGLEYEFVEGSLFDVALQGSFDIVASDGVLHHTAAKRQGFDRLVSFLKPGGFVFLGLGTKGGNVQRNLQRLILFHYAKSEADIVQLAQRFFPEHLDRAERFGSRSRTAIIYDTFVNPQIDTTSMEEILSWFRANNIQYYSSWPGITPMALVDVPAKGNLEGMLMSEGISALPELLWMAHGSSDLEQTASYMESSRQLKELEKRFFDPIASIVPESKVDLEELQVGAERLGRTLDLLDIFHEDRQRMRELLQEIGALLVTIREKKLEDVEKLIRSTKRLFRGSAGTGMNFIMGYSKNV